MSNANAGDLQSTHDGEADTVSEAQAGIVEALINVEGGFVQDLVSADDKDDAAGQEQAREAHGPRGAEMSSNERDRLVDNVIGREESWSLPEAPALNKARLLHRSDFSSSPCRLRW